MSDRVLYLVTCGAPLAVRVADGVVAAQESGWNPIVIPTEAATAWLETSALGDVPIIAGQRRPHVEKRVPTPAAVAVVPATFNTLNAWATGIANTYPLTTLCSALGARVPIVAVPFAKHDLTGHPAWLASLAVLRYAGVRIVDPSTGRVGHAEPVASGTGDQVAHAFRWSWVLDQLDIASSPSPD